jgi:hypothetical protein
MAPGQAGVMGNSEQPPATEKGIQLSSRFEPILNEARSPHHTYFSRSRFFQGIDVSSPRQNQHFAIGSK